MLGLFLVPLDELSAQPRDTPLIDASARQAFELDAGYRLHQVAAEPLLIDPVDAVVDDRGRLWVVEMRDYPLLRAGEPTGQISLLVDSTGDGRYDTRHTFVEQLDMPTGLALWKDGVLVTLAGQLVHFRDTDGDLRADRSEVWLSGFAMENEQLRANHPRLGPDGWWYIANGLRGGTLFRGKVPEGDDPAVPSWQLGSRDVRIHPETREVELLTGGAQFGLSFDALGNRYVCSNRNPAVRVVLPQSVLNGNPLAGLVSPVHDVVPAGEASRVFPLVDAWTTSNLHAGQFTAACGVLVNSTVGPEGRLQHELYCCEPTGSLIKRSRTRGSAANEVAAPLPSDREWLASRDPWFRPVNMQFAPGGGLLVIDMHRAVIEHPQWVPEELRRRPDERWGDAAGRIYAIYPTETTSNEEQQRWRVVQQTPPMSELSSKALVDLIARSDDEWSRQLAARLLLERQDQLATNGLLASAIDASLPLPNRLASLWTVAALCTNTTLPAGFTSFLEEGRSGGEIDLQIAALNVLESRSSCTVDQWQSVQRLCLATPPSQPDVSLAAWLCLAHLGSTADDGNWLEKHGELLAPEVLEKASAAATVDAYHAVSLASIYRERPARFMSAWLSALESHGGKSHGAAALEVEQVAAMSKAWMSHCLQSSSDEDMQVLLSNMVSQRTATALSQATSIECVATLAAWTEVIRRRDKLAVQHLDGAFWKDLESAIRDGLPGDAAESQAATDNQRLSDIRRATLEGAIQLLALSPEPTATESLRELALGQHEPQYHTWLVSAWAARDDARCDAFLLEQLSEGGPTLRGLASRLLLKRPEGLAKVLEALEDGELSAARLGPTALQSFVSAARGETAVSLKQQLEKLVNSDRRQVVERYRECLSLPADLKRGQQVFREHCAACHRIGDIGYQVGPDISDSRTQQPLQLLTSILDPNLAIDNNYVRMVALTQDGQIFEGVVVEETADVIVIRGAEAKRNVLRRQDIEQLKTTGVSLMPEGIEAQIDLQSMADLIAYIKGWRYMDGAVPLQ